MPQVFVPDELLPRSALVGVGVQVLRAQHLPDLNSIEQSTQARCCMAAALARQWFGQLLRPGTHEDAWLVEGEEAGRTNATLCCSASGTAPASQLQLSVPPPPRGRCFHGRRVCACRACVCTAGLAGWLEEQYIRQFMGKNELFYR